MPLHDYGKRVSIFWACDSRVLRRVPSSFSSDSDERVTEVKPLWISCDLVFNIIPFFKIILLLFMEIL